MRPKIKYLYITFSDDRTFRIPAEIIASDRATYFATVDAARGDGEYATIFTQEFEYTLSDGPELIDWVGNSMDWEDVKDHAELWQDDYDVANYDEEFSNAEKDLEWSNDGNENQLP